MKNRILGYRKRIDELLAENSPQTDWESVLSEHLVQIGFFQHERLIHLIVTVTFALLEIISLLIAMLWPQIATFLLVLAVLVLLAPYISHYYLLENETQKMYEQYDKILKNMRDGKL
jgi:hypothetical protein